MYTTIPLSIAALLAVGIIFIGSLYMGHRIRFGCPDPDAYDEPADGRNSASR